MVYKMSVAESSVIWIEVAKLLAYNKQWNNAINQFLPETSFIWFEHFTQKWCFYFPRVALCDRANTLVNL